MELLLEIYTDGSFYKSPNRAGWGYLALHPDDRAIANYKERKVHHQAFGTVCLNKTDAANYLEAKAHTNNTGELSAIGKALWWIKDELAAQRLQDIDEVSIVSDSLYAIQMTRGTWKPQSNKSMIWRLKQLKKQAEEILPVRLRWTKAHTKEKTEEAFWNDKVDGLAKEGARSLVMRVVEESGPVLGSAGDADKANDSIR